MKLESECFLGLLKICYKKVQLGWRFITAHRFRISEQGGNRNSVTESVPLILWY